MVGQGHVEHDEHYPHSGVTAVPIRDLPPSQTALVWLSSNNSVKTQAFVRAATDVVHSRRFS
ncbi:MAG: hypothetical protein DLM60_01425 [Pseudonocardiales bacterium]|nr:MAG: hypothetical protein DLM60_01425 [Pseudonocardiales bacterium]